jgi:Rha family phage regulatory protein
MIRKYELIKFDTIEFVKENMTSMDLANVVGVRHKNLLRDLRDMSDSWGKVTGLNFELSEYKDSTGRTLPAYNLSKPEILFIASKYNDELRAKIIMRLIQLELTQKRLMQAQLDFFWDKEDQKDLYK